MVSHHDACRVRSDEHPLVQAESGLSLRDFTFNHCYAKMVKDITNLLIILMFKAICMCQCRTLMKILV